jgi:hypothetical protein
MPELFFVLAVRRFGLAQKLRQLFYTERFHGKRVRSGMRPPLDVGYYLLCARRGRARMPGMENSIARGFAAISAAALLAGCAQGAGSQPSALPAVAGPNLHARPLASISMTYVYIADSYSNAVFIFPAVGSYPMPVGSITQGVSGPAGIAIDKAGTLYVPNRTSASLTVYPAGQSSPSLTITNGLPVPGYAAVDPKGNLWVSNSEAPGNVVEYAKGGSTPIRTLTKGVSYPQGLAFDSRGDLLVVNAGLGSVAVFPPGANKPAATFGSGDFSYPMGITVDKHDNVYIGDFALADVFVFSKQHALKQTIFTNVDSGPVALTSRRIYVGGSDMNTVVEFRYNGKQIPARIHYNLQSAFGLAADPPIVP